MNQEKPSLTSVSFYDSTWPRSLVFNPQQYYKHIDELHMPEGDRDAALAALWTLVSSAVSNTFEPTNTETSHHFNPTQSASTSVLGNQK